MSKLVFFVQKHLLVFVVSVGLLLTFSSVKETKASYSCTPEYCSEFGSVVSGVFDTSCTKIVSKPYTCSGTDTKCDGGLWFYWKEDDCGDPSKLVFQGCCTSTPPADSCDECTLPSCPAPLTYEPTLEELKLERYRECNNEGNCEEDKKYGDCYEPYNNREVPTASLVIHPNTTSTSLNFSSSTHSGLIQPNGDRVNEPINMTATYTDENGSDDIEAVYVWLQTTSTTPTTPQYISITSIEEAKANSNSFGFMMHKEGSDWKPYIPNQDTNRWVATQYPDNMFSIKGVGGRSLVKVDINSVNTSGNSVTLDFDLDFANSQQYIDSGRYYIFVMANDIFGFTPYDNYQEGLLDGYWGAGQIRDYNKWINSGSTWSVDLVNPIINSLDISVVDSTKLLVEWNIADNQRVSNLVANIYASEAMESPLNITFVNPSGLTVSSNPYPLVYQEDDDVIGHLTQEYAFKKVNINSLNEVGSVTIDTGLNRGGGIIIHITAFDYAGNIGGIYKIYDLRDWMITKGGFVYSSGGLGFDIKSLEEEKWIATSSLSDIGFLSEKADISTELFHDAKLNSENPLLHASSNLSYYINKLTLEVNKYENSMYTTLLETFNRKVVNIEEKEEITSSTLSGNMCDLGDCSQIFYAKVSDLTVEEDFNCNGKGVFFVEEELTITPNVVNSNYQKDACIFVVKGNVNIGEGSDREGNEYDEINAFIITDGKVSIEEDTEGLIVRGGLVGNSDDTIDMRRYLDLSRKNEYPVLAVLNHPKYGIFSKEVFGNFFNIVKTEVGFKPF